MVRGAVAGIALCGSATTNGEASATVVGTTESLACHHALVADGRYQRFTILARSYRDCLSVGLYPIVKTTFLDGYHYFTNRLLVVRPRNLAICSHSCDSVRLETSVVGWLVAGCTADGLCLAIAPMAFTAGSDRIELLPHPPVLSATEWL